MKKLLGISAVVVPLAFILFLVAFGDDIPTPPPKGFDATNFQPLKQLKSSEEIEVVDLTQYGKFFESGYFSAIKVAYFTMFREDGSSVHLFVGAKGKVIGKYETQSRPRPFPMGHYFVAPDGYFEVSAEGISPLQSYQEAPAEDLGRIYHEAPLHRSMSAFDLDPFPADMDKKAQMHVMLHNGVWKKIVSMDPEYYSWKTATFNYLARQHDHPKAGKDRLGKLYFGGKYSLRITHFDEQEHVAGRAAMIGSPTGIGRSEKWRGTGYYTVDVGEDALRFSLANDVLSYSGNAQGYLAAEGHNDLDFLLVLHSQTRKQFDAYLIRSANP